MLGHIVRDFLQRMGGRGECFTLTYMEDVTINCTWHACRCWGGFISWCPFLHLLVSCGVVLLGQVREDKETVSGEGCLLSAGGVLSCVCLCCVEWSFGR